MLGDTRLEVFLIRARSTGLTISDLLAKKDAVVVKRLYVPTNARYFVTASPENFNRNNQMNLLFDSEVAFDLAFLLINSNVFYWHWRVFGDAFDVTSDDVLNFPLPCSVEGVNQFSCYASRLHEAVETCRVTKLNGGKLVANINFNKRMDILLDIDDWIVKNVAPDLNLPRDIFAQYKSNSFLRPLDLSAITGAAAEVEDKE